MQDSTCIGPGVHKRTISVAVSRGKRVGEVRHWGTVPQRPDHVRKLVEKLGAGGRRLHFCHEAGPCGMAYTAKPWRLAGLHRGGALAFGVGGFQRFETPRQLMAYLGLTQSEHSAGDSIRRGGIDPRLAVAWRGAC